jgi:hypothetical protein
MRVRLLLPWLLAACSLIGLAWLYGANKQKEAELASLRADSQQLQQLRADAEEAKKNQTQNEGDELGRLRKDHEELLRLRNEVRQLRGDKQQLAGQVQAAQSQAASAQAQFQAQAQAIKLAQATPTNTPQQQAAAQAFAARYGLPPPASPEQANANACINYLRQIDAAKQQWASVMQKPNGAILTAADLLPFLPGNTMPTCPAGGIYTLNPVGQGAICNIPGHAVPK